MDVQLTVTDEMKIKASHSSIGNEGDHNFTRFYIERPSSLRGYTCRADFLSHRAGVGQSGTKSWLPVYDDTFLLPNSLTRGGKLSMVLTYGSPNGEITARTSVADFAVGQTISAVDAADTEFQDGLAQLAAKVDRLFDSEQGLKGEPGASAYELAVREGFSGTPEEWLESLVGPPGEPGKDGDGAEIYDKLPKTSGGILKLTGLAGTSYIEFPDSIIDFKNTPWAIEMRVKINSITDQRRLLTWDVSVGGQLRSFAIYTLFVSNQRRIRFHWTGETSFNGEINAVEFPIGEWVTIWFILHSFDVNNNGVYSYGIGPDREHPLYETGTTQSAPATAIDALVANNAKCRIGVGLTAAGAYTASAEAEYEYIRFYNDGIFHNKIAEFTFLNAGQDMPVLDDVGGNVGVSAGTTRQVVEETILYSNESVGLGNVINEEQLPAYYDTNADGVVDTASELEFGLVNYRFDSGGGVPLLSFTSDDGRVHEYTVMKPIFEEYGIPLNCAIITQTINQRGNVSHLSQRQLQELHALGWSIVSHSHGHKGVNTLTVDELHYEFATSQNILKRLGLDYDIFVLPGGYTNALARNVARNYYKCAFNIDRTAGVVTSGYRNYPGAIENMDILRINCIGETGVTVQKCKDAIDAAIAANNANWLVFMNHSYNLTETHITDYRAVIEYALQKQSAGQLKIVNLRDGFRLRGNVLEAGDFEGAVYTRVDRNGKMRCKGAVMV